MKFQVMTAILATLFLMACNSGSNPYAEACKTMPDAQRAMEPCCNENYKCSRMAHQADEEISVNLKGETGDKYVNALYSPEVLIWKTASNPDATVLSQAPVGHLYRRINLKLKNLKDTWETRAVCLNLVSDKVVAMEKAPLDFTGDVDTYLRRKEKSSADLYALTHGLGYIVNGHWTPANSGNPEEFDIDSLKCVGSDVELIEIQKDVKSVALFSVADTELNKSLGLATLTKNGEFAVYSPEGRYVVSVSSVVDYAVNSRVEHTDPVLAIVMRADMSFQVVTIYGGVETDYSIIGGTIENYAASKFPSLHFMRGH